MTTSIRSTASLSDGRLVLDTGRIRRVFDWNGGAIRTRRLECLRSGRVFGTEDGEPDFRLPAEIEAISYTFSAVERDVTPVREAHLEATISADYGDFQIRRVFKLFDDCPMISCEYYYRGSEGSFPTTLKEKHIPPIDDADVFNTVEKNEMRIDRFSLPHQHYRIESARFLDVTDRNNNLVHTTINFPYRGALPVSANILIAHDLLGPGGVMIIKESPGPFAHIAYPGYDFVIQGSSTAVFGAGIQGSVIEPDTWIRGYGVAIGVFDVNPSEELHEYQQTLRRRIPSRDDMILMNTWGDRGQDTKIGERFAAGELDAGAKLGITHFQLDDGWQSGKTINSATAGGSLDSIWESEDYWKPHPDRFPAGLAPTAQKAAETGIELCVWFNPSADDSYANWRNDADVLINLYKTHGIRTFKIDGVKIPDKLAEIRLRRMFDTIMEQTGDAAVFNLDVTAGRRFGYFTFREYGNLFLENRYTDTASYYPHWTLRNLWSLARYIPPQTFQIEFLNIRRNADKYPANDPLAPGNVSFEYCFAITMMSQPLAWFEGTGLPEEAFEIAETVRRYREHQKEIHDGIILPVGDIPTGTGWCGFQSMVSKDTGYIQVFRERNDAASARIGLHRIVGTTLLLEPVCGSGRGGHITVDGEGYAEFELPGYFSYALYRYRIRKQ